MNAEWMRAIVFVMATVFSAPCEPWRDSVLLHLLSHCAQIFFVDSCGRLAVLRLRGRGVRFPISFVPQRQPPLATTPSRASFHRPPPPKVVTVRNVRYTGEDEQFALRVFVGSEASLFSATCVGTDAFALEHQRLREWAQRSSAQLSAVEAQVHRIRCGSLPTPQASRDFPATSHAAPTPPASAQAKRAATAHPAAVIASAVRASATPLRATSLLSGQRSTPVRAQRLSSAAPSSVSASGGAGDAARISGLAGAPVLGGARSPARPLVTSSPATLASYGRAARSSASPSLHLSRQLDCSSSAIASPNGTDAGVHSTVRSLDFRGAQVLVGHLSPCGASGREHLFWLDDGQQRMRIQLEPPARAALARQSISPLHTVKVSVHAGQRSALLCVQQLSVVEPRSRLQQLCARLDVDSVASLHRFGSVRANPNPQEGAVHVEALPECAASPADSGGARDSATRPRIADEEVRQARAVVEERRSSGIVHAVDGAAQQRQSVAFYAEHVTAMQLGEDAAAGDLDESGAAEQREEGSMQVDGQREAEREAADEVGSATAENDDLQASAAEEECTAQQGDAADRQDEHLPGKEQERSATTPRGPADTLTGGVEGAYVADTGVEDAAEDVGVVAVVQEECGPLDAVMSSVAEESTGMALVADACDSAGESAASQLDDKASVPVGQTAMQLGESTSAHAAESEQEDDGQQHTRDEGAVLTDAASGMAVSAAESDTTTGRCESPTGQSGPAGELPSGERTSLPPAKEEAAAQAQDQGKPERRGAAGLAPAGESALPKQRLTPKEARRLKVVELRVHLRAHNQPTCGNKARLLNRLIRYLTSAGSDGGTTACSVSPTKVACKENRAPQPRARRSVTRSRRSARHQPPLNDDTRWGCPSCGTPNENTCMMCSFCTCPNPVLLT
jgi:hypothetical protein